MNFLWCTIDVNDMEESLKFYQNIVGLSLDRRFMSGPKDIVFLGKQETKVELICDKNNKISGAKTGISLGFEVNSVDDMIRLVKQNGYDTIEGPFQPNPHTKFFFITDPDGVKIQFVENK